MKLITKTVTVEYRDSQIECKKSVYKCDFCGFELHEKWMEEKMEAELARIYQEKTDN